MSSSQSGAGAPDDRQPLTRFMRRASRVLSGKNRASTSSNATSEPPQSPTTSRTIAPPPPPTQPQPTTQQAKLVRVSESTIPIRIHTSMNPSNAILEERARALFAKYGLTLEPGEWTAPVRGTAERVEKKVRMRVHRQCHRCSTTFGAEKICVSCQHTRCKKCPRYPTKKPKDGGMILKPGTGIEPPRPRILRTKSLIGMAQAGENDLVRKKPTQRVRRICHKCNTMFAGPKSTSSHMAIQATHQKPTLLPNGFTNRFERAEPPKRAARGIDDDGSIMKRLEERMGGLGVGSRGSFSGGGERSV
ncbi:MAG: hypothetical protein MMC33_004752 [Icmadophila ericetorum]|nr:hypothetical protein [Icmadophila ericetorum]